MPQRILVFRIGSLGDTLVSLPAMWAAKRHFPDAHFTLMSDQHRGKKYVLGADLLAQSGLFEDCITYPVDEHAGLITRAWWLATTLIKLRARRFDTLIYLAPGKRTRSQVERDRKFFKMAGIRHFYGMDSEFAETIPRPALPLVEAPMEADLLLARLERSGIPIPPSQGGSMDLGLNAEDEAHFNDWLRPLPSSGERIWVGVGPGSKMPAKIWPRERFLQVLRELVISHDVWPVIFGGSEDVEVGEYLVRELGRGYVAAGKLDLRASGVGLRNCRLYFGNDTGTMHLAAAVKVPCVAIFSARTTPGTWYPYGVGHRVFRERVPCEGCELTVCVKEGMRCLMQIDPDAVLRACQAALDGNIEHAKPAAPHVRLPIHPGGAVSS
jgi:ADP-heptose:LPS heptosyltransferase